MLLPTARLDTRAVRAWQEETLRASPKWRRAGAVSAARMVGSGIMATAGADTQRYRRAVAEATNDLGGGVSAGRSMLMAGGVVGGGASFALPTLRVSRWIEDMLEAQRARVAMLERKVSAKRGGARAVESLRRARMVLRDLAVKGSVPGAIAIGLFRDNKSRAEGGRGGRNGDRSTSVQILTAVYGGKGDVVETGHSTFARLRIYEPHARFIEQRERNAREAMADVFGSGGGGAAAPGVRAVTGAYVDWSRYIVSRANRFGGGRKISA